MIGLDTNVLLRWLLRDDEQQAARADELITSLSRQRRGFVSQASLIELHAVLTRSLKLPKTQVLDVLERLLELDELEFEDGEGVWRSVVLARGGADFPDALIADVGHLFGCDATVTFDRRAARYAGMTLLT